VKKTTKSGKPRRPITRSETVSVANDPLFFQKRLNAVLYDWKADQYAERVMIADGASVLWELGKTIVQPTVEILDIRHAQSHIHDCAKALFGHKSSEARNWGTKWCKSLKTAGPKQLLEELEGLSGQEWNKDAGKTLSNLVTYVTDHYARMAYPSFINRGFPIASGAIESANRQVIGDRCKRAGMRWSHRALQRLISLRAGLLSDNWDRVCRAIREDRSYARLLDRTRQLRVEAVRSSRQRELSMPTTRPKPSRRSTRQPNRPKRPTNTQTRLRHIISPRKMNRLIERGIIRNDPISSTSREHFTRRRKLLTHEL